MNATRFTCFAFSALVALPALAAQQGSLGATSTGSYLLTANGPATPRRVQVLNLSDVTFTNDTRSERNPGSPGATMAFCVIDTYGGTVNFSLSNAADSGYESGGWRIKAQSGEVLTFLTDLTDYNTTSLYGGFNGSNVISGQIPSGTTVTGSGACGPGNVKIHNYFPSGQVMPETIPARSYSTTITMVVSPQ